MTATQARRKRIERIFDVAVIAAAVLTIPLTYAHIQAWDGLLIVVLDWALWGVFVAEYAFIISTASDRRDAVKRHWLHLTVIVVSLPLLPHLLELSRLARLVRPIRLLGGMRIGRPLAVARLYVIRAFGGRRGLEKANITERLPVVGDESKRGGDAEDSDRDAGNRRDD